MKHWMKIAAVTVSLLAIAIVVLFFLVNANTFRPLLETQLSAVLGRQVTFGNLRFSPLSGSLVANDLIIAGDPNYSAEPFLTAKELRIGVEMRPLLFTRRLRVRSLELKEPKIHFARATDGSWNFSTIGRSAGRVGGPQQESAFPNLIVELVAIRNGSATVVNFPVQVRVRVYDHLDIRARHVSLETRFPFTLSVRLPGDAELSANGTAGPVNPQDTAMTSVDAQISVRHLDPVVAGILDPSIGVSMLADISAHATYDGTTVNSTGTLHLQRLRLVKTGSPARRPVDLTYNATQNLQDKTGQLHRAQIYIGKAAVQLTGVYRLDPDNPWLNIRVTGNGLPIDELQALMASAGVHLPNGSMLHGGTLSINLGVVGPANNLVITGPVAVEHTRLVGYDLGSKISGIAALGGIKTGNTSEIQALRLNLLANNAGLQITHIDALIPAIGEATGSGIVSPAGALAFQLVVKVTAASGLGKIGVGLLTKLNGATESTAKEGPIKGVPMLVTGTANDPVIRADMKGLMRRHDPKIGGKLRENNPKAVLGKLFGRNKKNK